MTKMKQDREETFLNLIPTKEGFMLLSAVSDKLHLTNKCALH